MRNVAFPSAGAFGLAVLMAAAPALGVIKPDTSLQQVYGTCVQVIQCEVTTLDAAKRTLQLKVVDTATPRKIRTESGWGYAKPPSGPLSIELAEPPGLIRQIAKGDPAVVFVGLRGTGVHLADTWLAAEGTDPKAMKIIAQLDLGLTFPGRTTALVKVLAQIRSGKALDRRKVNSVSAAQMAELGWPLVDWFEHSNWGQAFDLGETGVANGTAMASADASGDGKADLVIVAGGQARFFLGTGPKSAFREATAKWGLDGAGAQKPAFGDLNEDRKADLLLDKLWGNTGSGFVLSKAAVNLEGRPVLAAALEDVTGDDKRDAVALLSDGSLIVYENPGRTDAPWRELPKRALWTGGEAPLAAHFANWGDTGKLHVMVIRPSDVTCYALHADGGPPAGIPRLTGWSLDRLAKTGFSKTYLPIRDFTASVAIDANGGDGRVDLCIHKTPGRGRDRDIVLMNRGYGAFLFNNEGRVPEIGDLKLPVRGRTVLVAMAAADMYGDGSQELLQLYDGGRLIQVNSPPYAAGGSPAGE